MLKAMQVANSDWYYFVNIVVIITVIIGMVIITATIAKIATITVVVFISVYLPVDSGIFPREQVASINLRSLGFTLQSLQF